MIVVVPSRLAVALAAGALALAGLVGGCTPLRGHTGYIIDAELVNSVQPGVDTRQSIQQILGKPTFTGQFDKNADWFYLARATRNYAFVNPHVEDQVTLRIAFTPDGTVQSVTRSDETRVASIDPSKKVTRRSAASAASSPNCSVTSVRSVRRVWVPPIAAATATIPPDREP